MTNRRERIRKWRATGRKHKYNKKSVAYRKFLKRLKARKRCPNCVFYMLGMNQRPDMCGDCKSFSNFRRRGENGISSVE